MSITFGTSLNDLILDCHKMLIVDTTHLGGLYKETLFIAIALDVGHHLFDVTGAIATVGNND